MKKSKNMDADDIEQPIAMGEVWFIRFRGENRLHKVQIEAFTAKAIALSHVADGGPRLHGAWLGWYARARMKFVERVK